ncbi:hypothetical protein GCM10009525_73820 [Streptosporangium amethystogenes subsp. fukuiense]
MPRAKPDGRSAGRTAPPAGRGAGSETRLARLRRSLAEATLWNDCPTAISRGESVVSDSETFRSPRATVRDLGSHDEPRRLAGTPPTRDETATMWRAFRAPVLRTRSVTGNGRPEEGAEHRNSGVETSLSPWRES